MAPVSTLAFPGESLPIFQISRTCPNTSRASLPGTGAYRSAERRGDAAQFRRSTARTRRQKCWLFPRTSKL